MKLIKFVKEKQVRLEIRLKEQKNLPKKHLKKFGLQQNGK